MISTKTICDRKKQYIWNQQRNVEKFTYLNLWQIFLKFCWPVLLMGENLRDVTGKLKKICKLTKTYEGTKKIFRNEGGKTKN